MHDKRFETMSKTNREHNTKYNSYNYQHWLPCLRQCLSKFLSFPWYPDQMWITLAIPNSWFEHTKTDFNHDHAPNPNHHHPIIQTNAFKDIICMYNTRQSQTKLYHKQAIN